MTNILVVGSANIDYALALDRLPSPGETVMAESFIRAIGGKGVNQAIAAARAGGSVAMVGCVGDDDHGQAIRTALETENIAVDHLHRVEGPSGVAVVMTAVGDTNMIAVASGANAMLHPAMLDPRQFADRDIVLCQQEVSEEVVLRAALLARSADAIFVLDPAPARPLPAELLARTDWLTPNESEAKALLGLPDTDFDPLAAARQFRALGVRNVAMKLGSRGSLLLGEDDQPIHVAPFAVDAVDTTAAGDSFNGALAVALGEGASPAGAARLASAAAALAVSRRGAAAAMPSRAEIEHLLARSGTTVPAIG